MQAYTCKIFTLLKNLYNIQCYKLIALASQPLTRFYPNSHQTCNLSQNIYTRNYFEAVENQPLFWQNNETNLKCFPNIYIKILIIFVSETGLTVPLWYRQCLKKGFGGPELTFKGKL